MNKSYGGHRKGHRPKDKAKGKKASGGKQGIEGSMCPPEKGYKGTEDSGNSKCG